MRKPWYVKKPRRHVHTFVEQPLRYPDPNPTKVYLCACGEVGYPVKAKS